MTQILNSFLEINADFKGVILDVWGVLHASGVPFKGVIETLEEMQRQNKKVVLLSNAPRRSSAVEEFLKNTVGIFKKKHYNEILTSGEAFFLKTKNDKTKKKAIYIGPEKDLGVLNGLEIELVSIDQKPNFAIITGESKEASQILPFLLKEGLPLYCLNPDIFITKQDGAIEHCAGFFALLYKEMGGEVIYFGKPYKEVYLETMKLFDGINQDEIIAVGDGMATDIPGAKNFGIRSVLCLSGIPSSELKKGLTIEEFLINYKHKPDFIIKSL